MSKAFKVLFLLTIILVLVSCSSKSKSSSLNDPNNPNGTLDESDLNYNREQRFKEGSIPLPEGDSLFKDVRFNYDSSRVSGMARQNLESNAQILRENKNIKVQLEGHCDERGTVEYNLSLGNKRAQSVYESLLAMGISPDRLSTISYGEELPLDSNLTEEAFKMNRRVHFSAYTE